MYLKKVLYCGLYNRNVNVKGAEHVIADYTIYNIFIF